MSKQPAVLLISPGILKWTDMDYGLPHLVSMGGYLREHLGVRVEILDLNYEGGDHVHLLDTIDELGPHLVIGLSCYSSFDYMRVMALARFLKRRYPNVPLVTGGYHASALPQDVVFDGSPFDAVVVGEGEIPMKQLVETLLGGGKLDREIYGPGQIQDLDVLPNYAWDLLARYWPRSREIGRKFQVYLARGCPYHCTFCMERAKSGYKWRSYSADRAVDELRRLATYTDLSHWVINIADPLFGFKRSWRRQVLEGIIKYELFPRQYWTLTRSDDLEDVDVELLAKARFSIGIGLESGSPQMLTIMQKGNKPDAYLGAMQRLARLSLKHGLNWASNVIVGHPGETMQSMRETQKYLTALFTSAKETCGWLSIDPFRLYPGAHVHEAMATYSQLHGTRFYHPQWWKNWYDGAFMAEHNDPSREVDFKTRVDFMYEAYGPLTEEIGKRFRGQGRSCDRVFRRSLEEQARLMSPATKEGVLQRAERAKADLDRHSDSTDPDRLRFPIGLHVKDPWVREREGAVRRLLDDGVLRTGDLIEALLQVPPELFMNEEDAHDVLLEKTPLPEHEGGLPASLNVRVLALGLEALEPALGDDVVDVTARSAYLATVLSLLVGERGNVLAMHPVGYDDEAFRNSLAEADNIDVLWTDPSQPLRFEGVFDGLWIGAAIPRPPSWLIEHLREPEGRAIALLGPRFRPQDLVSLTRRGEDLLERRVARARVPVLGGYGGWLPAPPVPTPARVAR